MTRTTTAVAVIAAAFVAASEGWLEKPDRWFGLQPIDQDEQIAIELQCRGLDDKLRTSCKAEMTESVIAGELDLDPILRVHCTRFDNLWADELVEIPPSLCIDRYGGWLHG